MKPTIRLHKTLVHTMDPYQAYLQAQRDKSYAMGDHIAGHRVTNLVGHLVRADTRSTIGRSALCVGCRNDHELQVLYAAGFGSVIGIDLIAPQRKPRGHGRCVRMDMHLMGFLSGCFDVVFACHSLEHAYDLNIALGEWRRVTRPGGLWAIEVPINFQTTATDRHDLRSVRHLATLCGGDVLWSAEPQHQLAQAVIRV